MQMYSADIFISVDAVFVAENELEARQMSDQSKETALTIPQDEFFSDRSFGDPLLANLSMATTFTYWSLVEGTHLVDRGPVEELLKSEQDRGVRRPYRLISGKALIGATVYIKASRRSEADTTFKALDQTSFKFSTNGNGLALLGLSELYGICFRDRFTCHILEGNSLKHRGTCARYFTPNGGRDVEMKVQ